MSILQNLWSDTAGRIFFITFACYFFGYMVYGGYIYTFFNRKGSLPFGLADFSIADLISIFPTAILTLINFIPRAIRDIFKGILIHLVIPIVVGAIIRFIINFQITKLSTDLTLIGYLVQASFIIWSLGYFFAVIQPFKIPQGLFVLIEIIGAAIFFISIPDKVEAFPVLPTPSDFAQQALTFLFTFIFSLEIITLPYLFGMVIAETAIKSDLLVKIDRITLSHPVLKDGLRKITLFTEIENKISFRELSLMQKKLPIDIEPDVYEWSSDTDKVLYLIATFERFALLLIPGTNSEENRMIMLNRNVILSMELSKQKEHKTQ